ncbi:MAG: adenylyltransferase/cytidyltransferase family protein [Chitinophagaceae bacterium]|nr:adenylyltransferase/cytidyltransferase family protein [Chitinophagaceae bacterium]
MPRKKILVSGCFDMLHSGHVAFLTEAAAMGDLYVCIGSDETVKNLKGRYPVNTQEERKYMLEAMAAVHECRINTGSGILDFLQELNEIRPDILVVNHDGHTPQKEQLCRESGIEYVVLERKPFAELPARSTTALRDHCDIPFRIDLAGGWLDQPFVSKYHPGPVLTISIEPGVAFNHRSGMASSTRNKAIDLWKTTLPKADPEKTARILFSYENPPGTQEVAGSQDALGIVLPGLNHLFYAGGYWPTKIISVNEEGILQWLEQHLWLINLGPREHDFVVLENTNVTAEGAKALADSAEKCWQAILEKDLEQFGQSFSDSFHAQVAMFPNMADGNIYRLIDTYKEEVKGYKLSGAGGGGYLILVSEKPVSNALQVRIRRKGWL